MYAYHSDSESFKNEPTKRFYNFFYPKLKDKEIDIEEFFKKMEVGISVMNRMQFFSQMKSGHKGITMDQAMLAWVHYGVSPNYLFGLTNEVGDRENIAAEPMSVYWPEIKQDLGKIRKLLDKVEEKLKK